MSFSITSTDHHANSLLENSRLLSPATSNLLSLTRRRTDRSALNTDPTVPSDLRCQVTRVTAIRIVDKVA